MQDPKRERKIEKENKIIQKVIMAVITNEYSHDNPYIEYIQIVYHIYAKTIRKKQEKQQG